MRDPFPVDSREWCVKLRVESNREWRVEWRLESRVMSVLSGVESGESGVRGEWRVKSGEPAKDGGFNNESSTVWD